MKKALFMIAASVLLTGCIDVVRGYKTNVYVKADNESKLKFSASPDVTVEADKQYTDTFKTKADVSKTKTVEEKAEEAKEEK